MPKLSPAARVVSHFSCGAASATATKLALGDYPAVTILRAWLADEHEDNDRFSSECQQWFGYPIITLADWKYKASAKEVFRRERFIKNRNGSPCREILKTRILAAMELPGDTWIVGYTSEEVGRLHKLQEANRDRVIIAPLIDRNLAKSDCLAIIERVGIALPVMYQKGYNNNNCKCCPKGGEGYFNRQRVDFPDHYEKLCQIQDTLGPGSYLFRDRNTGVRFSLRDLPPGSGRHKEPEISCSAYCELAEEELT